MLRLLINSAVVRKQRKLLKGKCTERYKILHEKFCIGFLQPGFAASVLLVF